MAKKLISDVKCGRVGKHWNLVSILDYLSISLESLTNKPIRSFFGGCLNFLMNLLFNEHSFDPSINP